MIQKTCHSFATQLLFFATDTAFVTKIYSELCNGTSSKCCCNNPVFVLIRAYRISNNYFNYNVSKYDLLFRYIKKSNATACKGMETLTLNTLNFNVKQLHILRTWSYTSKRCYYYNYY